MPEKGKNRKAPISTGRVVLGHAADIATLGDRWFVSLASGFGMFGGRTRKTAAAVSESRPLRPESEVVHSEPSSSSRGQRFDVVSANDADSWSPLASGPRVRDECDEGEERRGDRTPVEGMHSAGVMPLLQALARVVSEHSGDEYAGLADDERLWTLIQLLQALGVPGKEAHVDDDGFQPEEPQQTRQG
jgi:hypothetical protein